MSENTFLRAASYYKRSINPISQYAEHCAYYLHKMTNQAFDYCKDYIIKGIKSGKFKDVRDPEVEFFERNDYGDRHPTSVKLSNYIGSVVRDDLILAPTYTCYVKPRVIKSLLADFTIMNKKARSIAKKAAAKAKADGNIDLYIIKNNEQDNRKRYNNSLSGCFVAGGSVVNNPTAHSTLTSITRTVGALGNASNEKIISGNRHYRNPDITLSNIIAITAMMDKEELKRTIEKFGLVYPTVKETMECIRYSSDLYWRDEMGFKKILAYLQKLEPVELAGIVYIGDFYHLRKHNEKFVHKFVTQLARKIKGTVIDGAVNAAFKTDELVMNYAHQICMTEMRGMGKKYDEMSETSLNTVLATARNIETTIEEYRDLVNAIFLTKIIPASTAYLPNMIRRSVVLSDTDSTMFSCDEWVQWYFNELNFEDEGFALSGAVMFIATQCIAHLLAIFSANMNVEDHNLFVLAMKPEFVFPVFAQSTVAKHYFTMVIVKEGSVYEEPEMEIKGVHLKSSATPKALTKDAAALMKTLLVRVMDGKKISIRENLLNVIRIEEKILESLQKGGVEYLKTSKIKDKEAYSKGEMESPYQHHQLWLDVFVPKYHFSEPPTYGVYKIPTILNNKTKVVKWLNELEDQELAGRMREWLTKYKKTSFGTFYVSQQYANSYGIPKEIIAVMDVKRIVLDMTTVSRMILATLGYMCKSGWLLKDSIGV